MSLVNVIIVDNMDMARKVFEALSFTNKHLELGTVGDFGIIGEDKLHNSAYSILLKDDFSHNYQLSMSGVVKITDLTTTDSLLSSDYSVTINGRKFERDYRENQYHWSEAK